MCIMLKARLNFLFSDSTFYFSLFAAPSLMFQFSGHHRLSSSLYLYPSFPLHVQLCASASCGATAEMMKFPCRDSTGRQRVSLLGDGQSCDPQDLLSSGIFCHIHHRESSSHHCGQGQCVFSASNHFQMISYKFHTDACWENEWCFYGKPF